MKQIDIKSYLVTKNLNADLKQKTNDEIVDYLTNKYFEFEKSSVENVLLSCFLVFSASTRPQLWVEFCKTTKLDEEKHVSQIKKYKVIGKNFEKLMKFIDVLPNRWSTIYQIAELSEDVLIDLENKNVLHPNALAKDIISAITEKSKTNRKPTTCRLKSISISLAKDLNDDQLQSVIQVLTALKERNLIDFTNPLIQKELHAANDTTNISKVA